MHCISLAILSRLSRFPSPAVGTNWPFCVDVPLKHQSISCSGWCPSEGTSRQSTLPSLFSTVICGNSQFLRWTCWCVGLPVYVSVPVVVAGDINIQLDQASDANTVVLGDFIASYGLIQLVNGITHDDEGHLILCAFVMIIHYQLLMCLILGSLIIDCFTESRVQLLLM